MPRCPSRSSMSASLPFSKMNHAPRDRLAVRLICGMTQKCLTTKKLHPEIFFCVFPFRYSLCRNVSWSEVAVYVVSGSCRFEPCARDARGRFVCRYPVTAHAGRTSILVGEGWRVNYCRSVNDQSTVFRREATAGDSRVWRMKNGRNLISGRSVGRQVGPRCCLVY